MYFGEVDHLLAVGEVRHPPLSAFLVPLGIVDDGFDLVLTHEDVDYGGVLLDLFLLVADGVEQLLLFLLVLVLDVLEFDQIGRVLLFDFLEAGPHLIDFLVETLVVFLNVEQLVLTPLLLTPELLLLLLLLLELLLEFLDLLHFCFILAIRSLSLEVALQLF